MTGRKAQIAVFLIIGMIIMFAVIGFSLLNSELKVVQLRGKTAEIPQEAEPVNAFVEACLGRELNDGIILISSQGGYYKTPEPEYYSYPFKIPYYYYQEIEKIPGLDDIEAGLSSYINDNLPACLDNFESFRDKGYDIDAGGMLVKSRISDHGIVAYLEGSLTVKKGTMIITLDNISTSRYSKFGELYSMIMDIMSEQRKDYNSIPISYMATASYENNLSYELTYLGDGSVIFKYMLNESVLDKSLVYSYAVKYHWKTNVSGGEFYIEHIPEFNLTSENQAIEYQVQTNSPAASFYDYSDLLDIDTNTGWVEVDSYGLPNGRDTALIKAVDENGVEAYAYMVINIDMPDNLPAIEDIGNQTAYVGKEFSYKVNATDPSGTFLTFLDDTTLFDIDVITGQIRFIPTIPGNYSIKITAVNSFGHTSKYLRLGVK